MNNAITLYNPKKLVFGPGVITQMAEDIKQLGYKRLFIITISNLEQQLDPIIRLLHSYDIKTKIVNFENGEPYYSDYYAIKKEAVGFNADCITGIGGGSVMDIAKVVAALLYSETSVESIAGINILKEKGSYLICVPTTSGTGSEVSPNSILIDDNNGAKIGIISPFLIPDAAYIDPELTISLPPAVTAFTGIDALTHCIEAYANKFAHPIVDTFALQGIKLICNNLKRAYDDGKDIEARTNVALGSVYGGMCLGPVNTAAVHALAYPLGTEYKMAHGLSNAVLLPYVMAYNTEGNEKKYGKIAIAAGALIDNDYRLLSLNGIDVLKNLISECNIKPRLRDYNIPESAIEKLAKDAYQIQRLLKNNLRELDVNDIKEIYKSAY